MPVTIVKNAQNRGFPAAINQGLQLARGEYLVLLNNDAVVTEGWLDQLIALGSMARIGGEPGRRGKIIERERHEMHERKTRDREHGLDRCRRAGRAGSDGAEPVIGLVGPMSNYATPPQLVEDVPYRDLDEMHAFARRWRDEHRGQWFTAGKLSGFCVLMKRAVYRRHRRAG